MCSLKPPQNGEHSEELEHEHLGERPSSDCGDGGAGPHIPVKPWTQTKRGPAERSLLPLASCNLHLSNNPFHYVAPTSMLSTDQSRFLDDTHTTAGVEWSCRETLGRSVGPLRKEDILHLKDVRLGQFPVMVVRSSAKAALSNYSLHLYSSACSIVSIKLSSSWNDSQNCRG